MTVFAVIVSLPPPDSPNLFPQKRVEADRPADGRADPGPGLAGPGSRGGFRRRQGLCPAPPVVAAAREH